MLRFFGDTRYLSCCLDRHYKRIRLKKGLPQLTSSKVVIRIFSKHFASFILRILELFALEVCELPEK